MIAVWTFIKERIEKVKYMAVIAVEGLLVGFILFEGSDPIGMISVAGYFL
jgi:uncharacterized protein related to proFAR isomerase